MYRNLCVIGLFIFCCFVACTIEKNPITGKIEATLHPALVEKILPRVSTITPARNSQITDQNPQQSDIQGEISIEFSEYMDEKTMIADNIKVQKIDGPIITGGEIKYYPNQKLLFFRYSLFPTNSAFMIKLSPNIKDINGNPLDGNGNGKNDGQYDEYVSQFYTSGGFGNLKDLTPPRITNWSPKGNGNLQKPTIRLDFATSDLDQNTLNTTNILLAESKTGTAVILNRDFVSGSSVRLSPTADLSFGGKYRVTVKAASIKDGSGNILDTDNDGVGLPNEADFYWEFIVADNANTDGTPPRVTNINTTVGKRAKVTFSEKMDTAKFTTENIRFYDSAGYIPGVFEPYGDETGLTYYFGREISGWTIYYFISMNVTDKAGNKLDGDGDGIGGEAGQDDYTNLP